MLKIPDKELGRYLSGFVFFCCPISDCDITVENHSFQIQKNSLGIQIVKNKFSGEHHVILEWAIYTDKAKHVY